MNDIFKDMQVKVGCDYISDLPSYKRKVWHEMKRLNLADYEWMVWLAALSGRSI